MFWDCPVFLTQLRQTRDTRDSPRLFQVLVREDTNIPQYLVSQDTQDVLRIPRTVPGSPTRHGSRDTKYPGIPRTVPGSVTRHGVPWIPRC